MSRLCNFTCCYCCQCAYEPHCVHKTAFVFDALIFGTLSLQFLSWLAFSVLATVGWVFFFISLCFFYMVFLSMRHVCTYEKLLQSGGFTQQFDRYVKFRRFAIFSIIGLGIIFAIVAFVVVSSKVKKGGIQSEDGENLESSRANAIATTYALQILSNFLIISSVLFGYSQSFRDSAAALSGPQVVVMNFGQTGGNQFNNSSPQPIVVQYRGSPPMTIGTGHAVPTYYNPPAPFRPQPQVPEMQQINLRTAGEKPS